MSIFATKGTKMFCVGCRFLILEFGRDVYYGEAGWREQCVPGVGQDFEPGDKLCCHNCGAEFKKEDDIILEGPQQ
jgi:hypothetical protein